MLGDSAASPGFGFASRYGSPGLAEPLAAVTPLLRDADIVFGNLEAVLSRAGIEPHRLSSVIMRGWPRFAADLRSTGFTVVSVANNHAMQHGWEAFQETRQELEAAGILCCGLKGEAPWECVPAIVGTRDGSRIGFLGYCLRPRQYHPAESYPFAEGTEESILRDVERLASNVSAVVVSLHWGEEFVMQPSQSEAAFARRLVATGARVLLGHHPHVLRPFELHGSGVIAYSLGNFVGDQVWHPDLRRGAILECQLEGGALRQARVHETLLSSRLAPRITGEPRAVTAAGPDPLPQRDYETVVERRLSDMRRAKYWYAGRNIWRNPGRFLQTVLATLRNRWKEALS